MKCFQIQFSTLKDLIFQTYSRPTTMSCYDVSEFFRETDIASSNETAIVIDDTSSDEEEDSSPELDLSFWLIRQKLPHKFSWRPIANRWIGTRVWNDRTGIFYGIPSLASLAARVVAKMNGGDVYRGDKRALALGIKPRRKKTKSSK